METPVADELARMVEDHQAQDCGPDLSLRARRERLERYVANPRNLPDIVELLSNFGGAFTSDRDLMDSARLARRDVVEIETGNQD